MSMLSPLQTGKKNGAMMSKQLSNLLYSLLVLKSRVPAKLEKENLRFAFEQWTI